MLLLGQRKTEQVKVLPLTLRMHRLGNDNGAVFDVPAQNHLCRAYMMSFRDTFDRTVSGVQIGTARHWRIRFDRNAMLLAVCDDLPLLPGGMQFDLVDCRVFAGLIMKSVKMLRKEVAHAKRLHAAFRAELDEGLPRFAAAPVERGRPMQHIHVDILELQQTELTVEGLACGIIALLGITQFGGDPDCFALAAGVVAGVRKRTAYASLVVVSGGAVDMTVSGRNGAFDDRRHAFIIDA